jgi:hypothetical protein
VADKKHKVLNVCSEAVLWAIWKLSVVFKEQDGKACMYC